MPDFQRDLMFLLHDVARLMRVDADKRARAHGMTRAQWGILIWLERQPGLSQKELAEILEVEPITVARLIDRLETRGMVERRPDPKDRRANRLFLTESGRQLVDDLDSLRDAIATDVLRNVPADALQTSLDTLVEVKDRIKSLAESPDIAVK